MDPNKKTANKANLYTELYKLSQSGDFDRSLKICNKILHEFPDEVPALEGKVVCLIQLSRFSECIGLINKNSKLAGNVDFEEAYCLYRLNKVLDAKAVLERKKETSLKKKELLSQIMYRLEQYDDCYDAYRDVIKNSDDEYEDERQTNLAAISACMSLVKSAKATPTVIKGVGSYELEFNNCCNLAAHAKYPEAEKLLDKTEKLCVDFLKEDELGDEEIEEEVAMIRILKGYCAQKQGRNKEAMNYYSRVLKTKPNDVGLIAIASNNVLSLNKDQNIFDSKRRVRSMRADGIEYKTLRKQQGDMLVNIALFYLYTNQQDQCRDTTNKLISAFPNEKEIALLIQAAIACRAKNFDLGKKIVFDYVAENKSSKTKMQLSLVQHLLSQGKKRESIELLKSLGDDYYRPGITSALVTLLQAEGLTVESKAVIKDAVGYYRKIGGANSSMNMLWRQGASMLLEQGEHEEAVATLEELRRNAPRDLTTLAQLIASYVRFDIKKAELLSKDLPEDEATEEFDINLLESPNWLTHVKSTKKGKDSVPATPLSGGKGDAMTPDMEKKKRKKKKKIRLPLNYDPARDPDSERWLPRYARSGFKAKRVRKGRAEVGKGTQGVTSEDAAKFDMTVKSNQKEVVEEVPTPSSSASWKKKKRRK